MQVEIEALAKALEAPERPVMAVVGGAKVSSKLELLGNLVAKVDMLVIGGGMANTFLAARARMSASRSASMTSPQQRWRSSTGQGGRLRGDPAGDALAATEFKAHAAHRVALRWTTSSPTR